MGRFFQHQRGKDVFLRGLHDSSGKVSSGDDFTQLPQNEDIFLMRVDDFPRDVFTCGRFSYNRSLHAGCYVSVYAINR